MSSIKLLVIEDEQAIRDMIRFALDTEVFHMLEAESTTQAKQQLKKSIPDIILLDWMLPGQSGIDFIHWLKQQPEWQQIPIILLTAKAEEEYKVRGLEAGADDYITKPFSPAELIARIRTILRRGTLKLPTGQIRAGEIAIDTQAHRAYINQQHLDLTPIEYKLLHFFITHPERMFTRNQLIDHVWGVQTYIDDRTVDVQIRRLRDRLRPFQCDHYIKTVRGSGYLWSIYAR